MASISDQNWIVWNQGKNPLVNFNFMLRVELAVDLPCKSVRAFSRELEYDYIQEGGLNDYVHMRRKPISKPFTLEVERYVGVDYVDPLPLGADLVLPVMLFVSRAHDQFIPGVVARTYIFTGCTVMKKTYGDLVADQSGLLVETTTIGYREMLCVDIPWSEVGDNMFGEVNDSAKALMKDKSGAEWKQRGQELYEQAQQAKTRADTEFDAKQADALILEMESALKKLESSVAPDGTHSRAKAAADAAMKKDGKSLETILEEAVEKTRQAEAALDEVEPEYREKLQASQRARQKQADLERRAEDVRKRKNRLDETKKELEVQRDAIQESLPEALRDLEAAEQARDKAYETMLDSRSALKDAQLENARVQREFEEEFNSVTNSLEPGRQAVEREEENNRRAQEELKEAEDTYKQAEQALEEARNILGDEEPDEETRQALAQAEAAAQAAQQEMQRRKDALTKSGEALKQAQDSLKQAGKRAEEMRQAKETGHPEGSEPATAAAALAAAEQALEEAEQALDTADTQLEESRKLAKIQEQLDGVTQDYNAAQEEEQELNGQVEAAGTEAKSADEALAEQTEPYNSAKTALDDAEAQQKAANEAYQWAKDWQRKANQEYDRAQKLVGPLHNSLTNLKSRLDRVKNAQKSCGTELEKCARYNQSLQGINDADTSALESEFDRVQKAAKQTMFHEREVREMERYMRVGARTKDDAEATLEKAVQLSVTDTTTGG